MRRTIGTTTIMLLVSTALAGAANLAVKAPAYAQAPVNSSTTSMSVSPAGAAGATNNIGTLNAGKFGTGSLLGLVTTGAFTASGFAGPGTSLTSTKADGYTFGGFFGAQKQRGSWVFGIEADIDTTGIKATSGSSGINHGEIVGTAVLLTPTVTTSVSGIGATTDPGQTITSTGNATLPSLTGTGTIATGAIPVSTTVPSGIPVSVAGTTSVSGIASTGVGNLGAPVRSVTNPGQTITTNSTGATTSTATAAGSNTAAVPVTTTTTAGITAPTTVTGSASGITSTTNAGQTRTGTINVVPGLNLIQAGVTTADVTRSTTLSTKINELSSVRGKVGFVVAPSWMLYGTGGVAFASTSDAIRSDPHRSPVLQPPASLDQRRNDAGVDRRCRP